MFIAIKMRYLIVLSAIISVSVSAFSTTHHRSHSHTSCLSMAGMGMSSTLSKNKKGKKNKKGMGKTKTSSDNKKKYDVAKSMVKSEKLYDDLMAESIKALQQEDDDDIEITTEYIIAARCEPGSTLAKASSAISAASDWVPVAQICIQRPIHLHEEEDESDELNPSVRASISYYCREISYAATLAAPTLKSLPRSMMQYSAEPLDSFVKYVYEDVIEGKSVDSFVEPSNGSSEGGDDTKISMTKSKAREILKLDTDCKDMSLIKQAYKRQSMAYHPDRFVNSDKTREEMDESTVRFGLVKMAYEALLSGVRNTDVNGVSQQSWYESLGGKARNEFVGPIDLISVDKAALLCNKAFKSAVVGLDPELTMSFVARNLDSR